MAFSQQDFRDKMSEWELTRYQHNMSVEEMDLNSHVKTGTFVHSGLTGLHSCTPLIVATVVLLSIN